MTDLRASAVVDIAQAPVRSRVRIRGTIVAIRVEPAGVAPNLTARVEDSTGRIDAVFMGRRAIAGIEPGRHIELEGTVSATESLARLFNPRYELL